MLFIVTIRNCSEERLLIANEFNKQIILFIEKNFLAEFLPFVDNWLNSHTQVKDRFSSSDYSDIILKSIVSIIQSNPVDHRLTTFILRNSFKHIEAIDNFLTLEFSENVVNDYFDKISGNTTGFFKNTDDFFNFFDKFFEDFN